LSSSSSSACAIIIVFLNANSGRCLTWKAELFAGKRLIKEKISKRKRRSSNLPCLWFFISFLR
jgi:hypothetical protein